MKAKAKQYIQLTVSYEEAEEIREAISELLEEQEDESYFVEEKFPALGDLLENLMT